MAGLRSQLRRLERRLRPVALEGEWYRFLQAVGVALRRIDPEDERLAELLDEDELLAQARQAAATRRRPGDVLAKALEQQARAG